MSKETERGGKPLPWGIPPPPEAPFVVALSDCWYARLLRRAAMSSHFYQRTNAHTRSEDTYEGHTLA